jgi:hypothetical protein
MISVSALWLPILLAAVIVFVASSVIHMTPLWHKSDFPKMPQEAEVLAALRPLALPPGDYFIPRASGMKEMRTPEFKDKLTRGPVAVLTVMPNGPIAMNRSLAQWFVFLIVTGIFVAYVTGRSLGPGARLVAYAQVRSRRADLRAAHRGHLRLAVAALGVGAAARQLRHRPGLMCAADRGALHGRAGLRKVRTAFRQNLRVRHVRMT